MPNLHNFCLAYLAVLNCAMLEIAHLEHLATSPFGWGNVALLVSLAGLYGTVLEAHLEHLATSPFGWGNVALLVSLAGLYGTVSK